MLFAVFLSISAAGGWAAYKAYRFTRDKYRQASAMVGQVKEVAKALNPLKVSIEHEELRGWLSESLRVEPPAGYRLGFGYRVAVLDRVLTTVVVAIRDSKDPREVFRPRPDGGVDLRPGETTMFIFALLPDDPQEFAKARRALYQSLGKGEEAWAPHSLTAGGREVALLRAESLLDGKRHRIEMALLRGARIVAALGPLAGFDEDGFVQVLGSLARHYPGDDHLHRRPDSGAPPGASSPARKPGRVYRIPEINEFLSDGSIRLATMEDVEAWANVAKEKPDRLFWHVAKSKLAADDAFVVLKPIRLMTDHGGSRQPIFFVKSGVRAPATPHRYTIFLANGRCRGSCP